MKVRMAVIATCFFIGSTAYAQSPAPAPAQPAAQQQTGTPAQPAKPPVNPTAAPSQLLPALRPAPEQLDPAKEAAIRRLLDVTGTSRMGDLLLENWTSHVRDVLSRSLSPDRLQKFMDAFSQNIRQRVSSDKVADAIVPIYASHFSMDDIKGITQFYESPLGQRVVKTLPEVSQASQSTASQLVRGNAVQVLQGMADEYPELKPLLQSNNGARPQSTPGAAQPASPEPAPHLSQPAPAQPPHQ